MLTTAHAAALLGVTPRRVQAMIKAGRLPATKHGRDWQIKTKDLALVMNRQPGRPKGEGRGGRIKYFPATSDTWKK